MYLYDVHYLYWNKCGLRNGCQAVGWGEGVVLVLPCLCPLTNDLTIFLYVDGILGIPRLRSTYLLKCLSEMFCCYSFFTLDLWEYFKLWILILCQWEY